MNKNFMYGLGAVKYKDFVVGYIEPGSFDMGGVKPESTKINAEQVPGTPVLIIPQSNGSIAPTFNVIQGTLPGVRTERTDTERHASFQPCRQADNY